MPVYTLKVPFSGSHPARTFDMPRLPDVDAHPDGAALPIIYSQKSGSSFEAPALLD
jgi:hypothetical protein